MIPLSLLLVLSSLGVLLAGLIKDSQSLLWASLIASLGACGCLVASVLNRRRVALTGTAGQPAAQPIDVDSRAAEPALPAPTSPAPSGWPSPPAPSAALPALPAPPSDAPPASPSRPLADSDAVPAQRTDTEQRPASHPAADIRPSGPAHPTAGAQPSGDASPAADAGRPGDARPDPAIPDQIRPTSSSDDSGRTAPPAPADEPAVEDIPVPDALRVAQLGDEVLVVDGRPRYHLAGCRALADRATVPLPVSAARRGGFTPCAVCRPDSTLLARSRSTAHPPS